MYNGYIQSNAPVFVTCKELNIKRGILEQQDEVDATNERWRKLNAELQDRENECEDILKRLADCSDKLKPVEELLDASRNLCKSPPLFGVNIEKGRKTKIRVKVGEL